MDLFEGSQEKLAPFINRLLKNPAIRARYIAHVRTIRDQWLNWKTALPHLEKYRALIRDELRADSRKLTSFEAFENGIGEGLGQGHASPPGLKAFFDGRSEYLANVPELKQPVPTIQSVALNINKSVMPGQSVVVTATVSAGTPADRVFLYYSPNRLATYQRIEMESSGNKYVAKIPPQPAASEVCYYVEARTNDEFLTTVFYPEFAEAKPLTYQVSVARAKTTRVKINEIMASKTIISGAEKGPEILQGDWIELFNESNQELDLAGMYLTDNVKQPRKWQFPDGTKVAPKAYLLVAAGSKYAAGLHASFKLSKKGESVFLIDTDKNLNRILDVVKFGRQTQGKSFGRHENGQFVPQTPTPGKENQK